MLNQSAKEKTTPPKEDEHITQKKPERGTHGLHWEMTPSPSSLVEQALKILPCCDHEGFTIDPPKPP